MPYNSVTHGVQTTPSLPDCYCLCSVLYINLPGLYMLVCNCGDGGNTAVLKMMTFKKQMDFRFVHFFTCVFYACMFRMWFHCTVQTLLSCV